MKDDEIHIWMEYVEGISGFDLTLEMYEKSARALGRFQGRLYASESTALQGISNLGKVDYLKQNYLHYRSWSEVYDYIRSDECKIPKHLCEMLIDIDKNEQRVWERIEQLPIVFCHRDYWITNIFYDDSKIIAIDWDTAGWGYLGEDMASLISDEVKPEHMIECYKKCVPAYYEGFREYSDVPHISQNCIYELILVMFGYRLVEWHKFDETPEEKQLQLDILQKIYEIGLHQITETNNFIISSTYDNLNYIDFYLNIWKRIMRLLISVYVVVGIVR